MNLLCYVSICLLQTGMFFGQCPFCDTRVLESHEFYEDAYVRALCTHKPIEESHLLIIPKRHVSRYEELTEEELVHIHRAIQKVHACAVSLFGTTSYLLHQKNGEEVGQSVPHVHFHYIGKKPGDSSFLGFLWNILLAYVRRSLSQEQLKEKSGMLKEAMHTIPL